MHKTVFGQVAVDDQDCLSAKKSLVKYNYILQSRLRSLSVVREGLNKIKRNWSSGYAALNQQNFRRNALAFNQATPIKMSENTLTDLPTGWPVYVE